MALQLRVQGSLASTDSVQLLADAMSQLSGFPIVATRSTSDLAHWRALASGEVVSAVLEEAQFIDYRVRERGFTAVARARRDARFAVVVAPHTLVSSLTDLRTRRLAVRAPPSLAALRIHELFPDPLLAPVLVTLPAGVDGASWVVSGRVDAAMLTLEEGEAARGARIVLVTDALPGAGLALAPGVDAARRLALIRALTGLARTASGRRALQALDVEAFDPATDEAFEGAARLLRGTWPAY